MSDPTKPNDDQLAATRDKRPASRLTCAQCERMVLDAVDGTLGTEDKRQFDLHVASCPGCLQALSDAQRGLAWMEMLRAAPPEPPAGLVEEILARTSGDPALALPILRADTLLHPAPGNVLPFRVPAAQRIWARMPMMAQPRFAMTAAMAFFSIALTLNLTGVHVGALRLSDLSPSSIRHGFWDANARAVRYYDNLRVVYELQSRVRELQRQNDSGDASPAAAPAPEKPADTPADRGSAEKGRDGDAAPAGTPAKAPEPRPVQPVRKKRSPAGGSSQLNPRGGNVRAAAGATHLVETATQVFHDGRTQDLPQQQEARA